MKFYMANEQLDAQISLIKRKINLSMNGVTADSMKSKGVNYKHNFGVELPVLREMARSFSPSQDLAQRLWIMEGRETMILSVLLQPIEKLTTELAIERIKSAPQKEIIDVLCMYLLSKADFSAQLCIELLMYENSNCRIAAFMLASRIYNKLTVNQTESIIESCITLAEIDDYQLYKSIGICLGRLCRTSKDVAQKISAIVEKFQGSESPSHNCIANEVKQELDFLINL